jgi:tripartite-type tricarboxylate transporter receptor subunit TctC
MNAMSNSCPTAATKRSLVSLLLLAVAGTMAAPAWTQPVYPSRPIAVVIGYPPGGSVDAVGRAVVETLGKKLNATTVIENVGGAAGAIGVQKVVNAPADGYTLVFGSSSEFVATRFLNPAQKYDASRDLVPIGYVGSIPLVLVASTQSGVRSLAEFVTVARSKPGQLSYGTSGIGSMPMCRTAALETSVATWQAARSNSHSWALALPSLSSTPAASFRSP